jgi:chemotaxis protein methyltransferase CheR
MSPSLSNGLMTQLSEFVASRVGLHFPEAKWSDLEAGLVSASREKGMVNEGAYAQWLLSTSLSRHEVETLASHLTVGETYFFREKGSFDALEQQVLPELIRNRRAAGRRLRIWSAACCTGEEAYSVAMLLDRILPDISDWNITILATDINPNFLEKATAGIYREWSFRAIPPGIRDSYFSPVGEGSMRIAERIRQMVTFSFLNLAEDEYPSLVNNTNAMDVVLCRNVLMYFTPQKAARVVAGLHEALIDNGWLLVAPSEGSQILYGQFALFGFPDATFYRKTAVAPPSLDVSGVALDEPMPPFMAGRHDETPRIPATRERVSPLLTAQMLANRGELPEARAWCDRAILSDALNPAHRFLLAMIVQEQGDLDEAAKYLRQALYLDAGFVMAHFALGNLAMRLGKPRQSRKHFGNVLGLLEGLEPDTPVPEAGGLTAGRISEMIHLHGDGEAGDG